MHGVRNTGAEARLRERAKRAQMAHFALSGLVCFAIDKAIFSLVCLPLERLAGRGAAIAVALVVARVVSAHCNYFYNSRVVFACGSRWRAYWQYFALAVGILALSTCATAALAKFADAHGLAITLANVVVEVALFLLSYFVQKLVVFRA